MKKLLLKAGLTVAVAAISFAATAQTTSKSSWMLENNVYGHRYNAAYIPEKSYFGIGVGSVNPAIYSDIGVANILIPTETGLVSGFNDAVSAEQLLGGMNALNRIQVDLNENILSIGARGKKGGYSVFELNARVNVFGDLPRDLFAMLKEDGGSGYDLSGMGLGASAYAELSYGYARNLGDKVKFGFKVKGLCGLGSLQGEARSVTATSDSESIYVNADASLRAAAPFLDLGTKASEYGGSEVIDFENIAFNAKAIRPCGAGVALDLGVIIEPVEGLEIGVSVNDLGAMGWKYGIKGDTDADVTYIGERKKQEEGSESSFGAEMGAAFGTLGELGEFQYSESKKWEWDMLPFNVNAAIKWRMPFYRRLSFGAMGNYSNVYKHNSYDVRAGAAITPIDWFSLTGNAGISDFGPVWGAGTSISLTVVNIWLSMDGYMGKLGHFTPEGKNVSIPYPAKQFGYCVNVGVNFQFGKRVPPVHDRLNLPKAEKKALRAEKKNLRAETKALKAEK